MGVTKRRTDSPWMIVRAYGWLCRLVFAVSTPRGHKDFSHALDRLDKAAQAASKPVDRRS